MFHLHLTAMTGLYEKELIHGLVKKGYIVAPASDLALTLQLPQNVSALISLQLEKLTEIHATEIYADVIEILNEMNAKYYSLIITAFSYDAIWAGSNIQIEVSDNKALN